MLQHLHTLTMYLVQVLGTWLCQLQGGHQPQILAVLQWPRNQLQDPPCPLTFGISPSNPGPEMQLHPKVGQICWEGICV